MNTAKKAGKPFHIIISDTVLSDDDPREGFQVLALARKLEPSIKTIIMSGSATTNFQTQENADASLYKDYKQIERTFNDLVVFIDRFEIQVRIRLLDPILDSIRN